jgi:hypothetical protein
MRKGGGLRTYVFGWHIDPNQFWGALYIGSGGSTSGWYSNFATLNQWVHIAFVLKGNKFISYTDGKLSNEGDLSWFRESIINQESNEPLYIGTGDAQNFVGLIDDIRIYERALEPSEIHMPQGDLQFVDSGNALPGVRNASVLWADYDNDEDQDLLLIGSTDTGEITRFFKNDGNGNFTEDTSLNLPGTRNANAAWGDCDNDGDLDLAHQDGLYRNDGHGNLVRDGSVSLPEQQGQFSWVDYDNDGDLDLCSTRRIYRNDGAGHFPSYQELPYSPVGMIWGDMDGDGDMDVLLTGTGGSDPNKLYQNYGNGNLALDQTLPFYSGSANHSAWGDYDGDGDLDLVLPVESGRGNYGIYINQGNGSFISNVPPYLARDLEWPGVAWADMDNDGYLDLTLTGTVWPGNTTRIYRNDRQGNLLHDITQQLQGVYSEMGRSIGLADIDNDGDLDLAIAGHERNTENEYAIIYWNSASDTAPNSRPAPPSNLTTQVSVDTVYFSWSAGSDAETPTPSLTYNMRVGTTPGGNEILSGVTPPGFGNTEHGPTHFLKNLPNGAYYWSVQTVDAGFARSEWAPEATFTVNVTQRFTDTGQQLGNQNSRVAIGDLDNDTDLDIAVGIAEDTNNANRVYLNDGIGNFTDSGQMLGVGYTSHVLLVDVDNDGDLDIVSGNTQGEASRISINDGNAHFGDSGQSLPNASQVAWGDFNLDGAPDLVFSGSPVKLFFNNGTGMFSDSGKSLPNSNYVAVADLNSDKRPDLVVEGDVLLNIGAVVLVPLGLVLPQGAFALANATDQSYFGVTGLHRNPQLAIPLRQRNSGCLAHLQPARLVSDEWTQHPLRRDRSILRKRRTHALLHVI